MFTPCRSFQNKKKEVSKNWELVREKLAHFGEVFYEKQVYEKLRN